MRDAGLDDETIALRLSELDGEGGGTPAASAPSAPSTVVDSVTSGLAGAVGYVGGAVGQAGASMYSTGMASLAAALGGGEEPENPSPAVPKRSGASRTSSQQQSAMDRLTRGKSAVPTQGGHIRGSTPAVASAVPAPAPTPAPTGGQLQRPPGLSDADWEEVQLAHVMAMSAVMAGGKSDDEEQDGFVVVPPHSEG